MLKTEEYWFWLCSTEAIYRDDIARMLKVYPDPEQIFHADKEEMLQKHLITEKQKDNLEKTAKNESYLKTLEKIKKDKIRFICPDSPDYPEKLRKIPDHPYGLYVRGKLPAETSPAVGMVGARACTEYGKKMAFKFAKALALQGVQIVSGLAIGIDSISARGALSVGGKTFAVLGSGIDVVYPMENINLYYEIAASGGGVISEYPMGTQAIPWQFPLRNRLISGLSDTLLVMEARERSGTLITVRYALEQGRDVYALPGRLIDKASESCNQMIADGAGILISPEALLADLYKGRIPSDAGTGDEPGENPGLKGSVKKIYDMIGDDPVSVQYIIEKSHEKPEKAAAVLSELAITGLIHEVSKNNYVRIF